MKSLHVNLIIRRTLAVACCSLAFAATSGWATFVTWQLNPTSANAPVGSISQTYTVSGYSIGATGYDNNSGTGIAHELFFKNDGPGETGLGLTNTFHNELQVDSNGSPLHFIQLDITSILLQGFSNGQIEVGSVQSGELFNLYGSNALGSLGVKLNASPYDSSKDGVFVSVPNFGSYKFISIVSAAADVLPVAFRADIVPIPEAASLIPVLCLVTMATAFEVRRRRRVSV